MEENSGENSEARASEVKEAHNCDNVKVFDDGNHDHLDDHVLMKRMISSHPLFELLIKTHVNCLKLGLGSEFEGEEDIMNITIKKSEEEANVISSTSPELDNFMETYCMALERLKEAMEEPLKDSTSFINNMYAQLDHLTVTENE